MQFIRRVLVGDQERALVVRHGRDVKILEPGIHWILGKDVEIEMHVAGAFHELFSSPWTDFLVSVRPAVVEEFFTLVEPGDAEMAVVFVGGKVARPVGPGTRLLFWRGVSPVTAEGTTPGSTRKCRRGWSALWLAWAATRN